MDGSLTTHFFSHIKERIGDYKICVNQGFTWSGDATGFLVGPIPERSARQLHPLVRVLEVLFTTSLSTRVLRLVVKRTSSTLTNGCNWRALLSGIGPTRNPVASPLHVNP